MALLDYSGKRKKKKYNGVMKKFFIVLSLLLFGLFYFDKQIFASTVDYSIISHPSEKQIDEKNTYYDLKLGASESENLIVTVKNNSDKKIIVDVEIDKATTNSNGVVEYKNSSKHESVDLKHSLNDLVKLDTSQVILDPKQSKNIVLKVTNPKENFNGIIAGGINFTQQLENTKSNDSMAIRNQYSYSIALVLHGEKEFNKHNLKPGNIKVKQSNGRNNIYFPIENHTAAFLNKVNIQSEVYKKNVKTPVYSEKKLNAQVAPNSIYEYLINTNKMPLHSGKYTAKLSIESKGEKWSFTKDFEISKNKAKVLNSSGIIEKPKNNLLYFVVITCLFILSLLSFLFWFFKKRKKKDI